MTEDSDKQIAALCAKDMPSLVKYHETVAGGVDAILGRRLEDVGPIEQENLEKTDRATTGSSAACSPMRCGGKSCPSFTTIPNSGTNRSWCGSAN